MIKKKTNRFYFIFLILVSISLALFFVLKALNDKIVFFYTPTNLSEDSDIIGENIRVGGLVLENSIKYSNDGLRVSFVITDNKNMIDVFYSGILPDLFREKQGVVVEGNFLKSKKTFNAKKVLAKHDENYMPPEVKKAIKNIGK
jgi:cytochrome c-type biogenesis protein CcmE